MLVSTIKHLQTVNLLVQWTGGYGAGKKNQVYFSVMRGMSMLLHCQKKEEISGLTVGEVVHYYMDYQE
jgi:hypothetical protein